MELDKDFTIINWQSCPKCSTEDISASSFDDSGSGEVYRDVTCNECGFEWIETYNFSHNEEVL